MDIFRSKALYTVFTALVTIAFAFFIISWFESFTPSVQVTGTVTSKNKNVYSDKAPTQVVVALDNGGYAQIDQDFMGVFQKGKKVILQEYVSTLFSRKKYTFVRYEK